MPYTHLPLVNFNLIVEKSNSLYLDLAQICFLEPTNTEP